MPTEPLDGDCVSNNNRATLLDVVKGANRNLPVVTGADVGARQLPGGVQTSGGPGRGGADWTPLSLQTTEREGDGEREGEGGRVVGNMMFY